MTWLNNFHCRTTRTHFPYYYYNPIIIRQSTFVIIVGRRWTIKTYEITVRFSEAPDFNQLLRSVGKDPVKLFSPSFSLFTTRTSSMPDNFDKIVIGSSSWQCRSIGCHVWRTILAFKNSPAPPIQPTEQTVNRITLFIPSTINKLRVAWRRRKARGFV